MITVIEEDIKEEKKIKHNEIIPKKITNINLLYITFFINIMN